MLTQREFGEKLKATRKKLKLTQKTISEEINVGQGTLSQWEQGLLNPSLLSVAQFCEAFGLSLDDLLDLKKNAEPLLDTDMLTVSIETDELERVLTKLLTSPEHTIKLTLMIEKK